jgi:hypothetical protein
VHSQIIASCPRGPCPNSTTNLSTRNILTPLRHIDSYHKSTNKHHSILLSRFHCYQVSSWFCHLVNFQSVLLHFWLRLREAITHAASPQLALHYPYLCIPSSLAIQHYHSCSTSHRNDLSLPVIGSPSHTKLHYPSATFTATRFHPSSLPIPYKSPVHVLWLMLTHSIPNCTPHSRPLSLSSIGSVPRVGSLQRKVLIVLAVLTY